MQARAARRVGAVAFVALGCGMLASAPARADFVIADDLIVNGSTCTGIDCINGETFGFDTLRLKENNLRLHFDDTSASAEFPANDWRFVFNDSTNGGADYFSVQDVTGAKDPFRVDAGAPTNALRVSGSGRVGIGTASPALGLSLRLGNTPGVRMEQDGSEGWPPYTWDAAANEANFFVRDVTNGSRLVFRVLSGAPANSLMVTKAGGVQSAAALQQNARDTAFENEAPADEAALMTALRTLPLMTREFKTDADDTKHLWPTAADFNSAFGLGDANFLSPTDMAGVALVAAKAIDTRVTALEGAGGGGAGTPGPAGPAGPQGPPGPAGPGAGDGASLDEVIAVNRKQDRRIKKLTKKNRRLAKRIKRIERALR